MDPNLKEEISEFAWDPIEASQILDEDEKREAGVSKRGAPKIPE